MEQPKELYDLIGVSPKATNDEIKKAYKRMANKHHPDKGGDPLEFHKIQRAYTILSDPNKRARYDAGEAFSSDRKEPTIRDKAIQQIMNQLNDIFARYEGDIPKRVNVVLDVKRLFSLKEAKHHKDILEIDSTLEKVNRQLGRVVTMATDTTNLFDQYLESVVNELENRKAIIQESIDICKEAISILNEYDDTEYESGSEEFVSPASPGLNGYFNFNTT